MERQAQTSFLSKIRQLTGFPVYAEYAKTSNLLAVMIYGLMLIGGQSLQIGKLLHLCGVKNFGFAD